jgi:hypothetical protein
MRNRDKRAQRHQVQAMKRDFPDFEEEVGGDFDLCSGEESFRLKDGSAVDLAKPWPHPNELKD